jgi:hypothetical protein
MTAPKPRTDILQGAYNRLSVNNSAIAEHVAGRAQIAGALDDALDELAQRLPPGAESGNASIAAQSPLVYLPVAWLRNNRFNQSIIRAIYSGKAFNPPLLQNRVSGVNGYGNQGNIGYSNYGYGNYGGYGYGFQSRYSPTGRSLYPPLSPPGPPSFCPPVAFQLVNGVSTPFFALSQPASGPFTWPFTYVPRYQIIDGTDDLVITAVDNFDHSLDSILFRIIAVLVGGSQAFDNELKQGKASRKLTTAMDTLEQKEALIDKICSSITTRGYSR